jgi:hypothetical protein
MSFITLDEVTALAQSTTKDAASNYRLLCRNWICTLALPDLGISEDDIKVARLLPKNLTVPKPVDFRSLLDISVFDTNDQPLDHKYRSGSKRIYTDTRLVATATNGSSSTVNALVPVDISSDTHSFHLGTNGANVGSIVIRYYCYPSDENGIPLIRQEEAMACVFFCKYMWAIRQNNSRSEIEQFRQIWATECDRARARKKMVGITPEMMKTVIKSTWMRSIPSFDFRKF